ncbi:MAG: transglycosylase domain-containing protein [Burkholderiaceae bacterium]|nr:transglycosylase domain-containing protein [Burkholderiaceae bacterium]
MRGAALIRPLAWLWAPFAPATAPARRLRRLAVRLAWAVLFGGVALAAYVAALATQAPPVHGLLAARDERPSVLLAADGSVLATLRRRTREWIPLEQVPPHVIDALIATEDHRFYQHRGIDWRRTASAALWTLLGDRQGGSTITQQLARNFYPQEIGRAPTLARKVKEMATALRIERAYGKREILEAYLNTVPFHYNVYGLEMAARTYFDKPAAALSVIEGATLIGMLKGTQAFNPVLAPERARERRNVVLAQMVKRGRLAPQTFEALRVRPLRLTFKRQDLELGPAPHFAATVRRWLLDWAEAQGLDPFADGLIVQSTLDPTLQRLATQAVARQLAALQAVADVEWALPQRKLLSTRAEDYARLRPRVEPFRQFWQEKTELLSAFVRETPQYAALRDEGVPDAQALARLLADARFIAELRARKTRLEAGFVAIDPRSGQVRAWVGARDYALDPFDHVLQARRQPGSTFKPFVYGAALQAGVDPRREFEDRPVALRLPDGGWWRPKDAGGASGRRLTLEDALVFSRNGIAAQLVGEIGAARVAEFARRAGVRDSALAAVPALALGASEVSLLEMVSAYATLAAEGIYRAPVWVTRVTDRMGRTLYAAPQHAEAAVERDVAVALVDMLRAVVDRGTGRGIRSVYGIGADVAGKTGTSQHNADGWFILMHPQLVAGAWVGFNDPRVTMRSDYWGQGAHNALRVVGDFMQQAFAAQALDATAALPTEQGFAAALRRFGERLRRWFGFSD